MVILKAEIQLAGKYELNILVLVLGTDACSTRQHHVKQKALVVRLAGIQMFNIRNHIPHDMTRSST